MAQRGKSPPATASPASAGPRVTTFDQHFVDDLRHWIANDRKTALRLLDLVEAVTRDPFVGIGKPEPLKYIRAGAWSRRLTEEHRLVYRVTVERIDFLQARYHYCLLSVHGSILTDPAVDQAVARVYRLVIARGIPLRTMIVEKAHAPDQQPWPPRRRD